MPRFSDPERLSRDHELGGFDCGQASLGVWLQRYARTAAASGSARTYVVTDTEQERVVGFHSLTVASIEAGAATGRARRGMPRHAIPAVLLARLAVDRSVQSRGLGAFLLRDALHRTLAVSEQAGIRILLVHALNQNARAFYKRFGFEESPTDPLNLQLLIKDLRRSLAHLQNRP